VAYSGQLGGNGEEIGIAAQGSLKAMAKYLDETLVGSGGFGEVWICVRDEDGKRFAKKILKDVDDNECVKRFGREVRILSTLDHPNIIRVIGKRLETPPYFYIMPVYNYCLAKIIPALVGDEKRICKIFSSVIDAVEYAHSQGAIHRDLKPENILMNNDDDIVVSDFGLGRLVDSKTTRATYTGEKLGTPLYMPPEQIKDAKNADERADIYALGRILYELYTGTLSVGVQELNKLPVGIGVIVAKCTKPNPDERYQSVSDLKQVWVSLVNHEIRESEINELTLLGMKQSLSAIEQERLIELLVKVCNDGDQLHEALVKIKPLSVAELYRRNPEVIRAAIVKFSDFTSEKAWGFDYTDKIGTWCAGVSYWVDDPEVRVGLVKCVLVVGADHNRYHLLRMLTGLLKALKIPGELLLLQAKLAGVGSTTLNNASEYIDFDSLDPMFRKVFESSLQKKAGNIDF